MSKGNRESSELRRKLVSCTFCCMRRCCCWRSTPQSDKWELTSAHTSECCRYDDDDSSSSSGGWWPQTEVRWNFECMKTFSLPPARARAFSSKTRQRAQRKISWVNKVATAALTAELSKGRAKQVMSTRPCTVYVCVPVWLTQRVYASVCVCTLAKMRSALGWLYIASVWLFHTPCSAHAFPRPYQATNINTKLFEECEYEKRRWQRRHTHCSWRGWFI